MTSRNCYDSEKSTLYGEGADPALSWKYILIVAVSAMITGCATLPPCTVIHSNIEEGGEIVVYRPARLIGFGVRQRISVDGCSIGSLWNGKYVTAALPAGEHNILAEGPLGEDLASAQFVLRMDETVYFRWSETVDDIYVVGDVSGAVGSANLTRVSQTVALEEMDALEELLSD